MYVALDPIGSSSKKKNNKNSQIIKTTQTTPQVDPLVAIEEEKRRKRVQENRMLMNGVKKVSSEISESYDGLTAIEKMVDKCITGKFAKDLKSIMQNAQGQMEKVVNDLNVIGTKAAQNVKKEGEPCEYDKQQLNSEPSYNGNGKTTFSCNTDVLCKQVLPRLQDGIKKLAKTTTTTSNLPRLEGCEDVTNIPNRLEGITKLLKNSLTETEKLLERAEQAEEETKKIGEQLMEKNIDAITVALRTKPTSLLKSVITSIIGKALEQQEEKLTNIWINGIKHILKGNSDNNGNTLYYVAIPIMDVDENSDELKPAVVFLDVPEKDENGNRLADYTFDVDDETKAFQGFDGYVIIPSKENPTPEEVIEITEKILNKPDKYKINPKQIALTGKGNVKGIYDAVNEKNDTFTFCSYMNKINLLNQTREGFEKIFGIGDTPTITSGDDPILPKPIGDRELGDTKYYYDYESMGFLVDKVYLNENGELVYQKVPVNTRLYQKKGDRYMCGGNAVLSWRVALGGKIGGEDGDAYKTENGKDIDPLRYPKEDGRFPTPEGIDPVFYKIYDTRLADGGLNGGQRQFAEFSGADVVDSMRNDNNDRGDDIWNYLGLGDLAIGKWNGDSLFTDGGHYMTLGGLMENGKAILYDSALPWNTELDVDVPKGQVYGTIEVTKELEERYAEGFTQEEVTTGLVATFIVKPEFRTEYLRVDGQTNKNSFVITEEGQLMQIDFSELPECVDTNFNGVLIHESGIYEGDDKKGWFYYELEDPNNPNTVSNLVQTAACPIQYPSNPAKTLADAVNDGDITLEEALSSIDYAVENGNISNEKAQELIDGLPKS